MTFSPSFRLDRIGSVIGYLIALAGCGGESSNVIYRYDTAGRDTGGQGGGSGRAQGGDGQAGEDAGGSGRASGGTLGGGRGGASASGGVAGTAQAGGPDGGAEAEGGATSPVGGEGGQGDDPCGVDCTLAFHSDSAWETLSDDPDANPAASVLGAAQPVCLNEEAPANCPSDAVLLGYPGIAWGPNLDSFPGAVWIWGPGVSATEPADLTTFVFTRDFQLGSSPTGTISIAADDYAEVRVNGFSVGVIGSVTQMVAAQEQLTAFDLTGALVEGRNTLVIVAKNGPAWFAGSSTPCDYTCNPAGVVFGGTFTFERP